MSEIKIKNSRGLMRRVYGLSPSVEEAIERFASTSEENRLTIEEAKRLIKGQGYVRTKSRIYRLASLKDGKALVWKGYELVCIKESSILRKAASIEELCDEFVLYDPYPDQHEYLVKISKINGKVYYEFLTGTNKNRFDWQSGRERIYGAIWTEKGLIYVAALTEKGGFEPL